MDNGLDEEVVVGWVDKVFEAMPSCTERCHLMYRAKQGVRLGTVIMMQMLIASFRLTGSAFHSSIAEYDDTLLAMITMEVKTMVIDAGDTNEISDRRGGRWVCNHDEDNVSCV